MEKEIKQAYFNYLRWLVNGLERDSEACSAVFKILHDTEFYSIVKNDENREEDGKMFREMFAEYYPDFGNYDDIQGPCTALEMMIGVAYRMSFVTDKRLDYCFMILMNNLFFLKKGSPIELKLDKYNNFQIMFSEKSMDFEADIREIVRKMVARQYDKHGNGGLFPVRKSKKDQRNVEIWYQMMTFLNENSSLFE